MKDEDIPALIRDLRQRLGLTQEQCAQKVGVTGGAANSGENGEWALRLFLVKRPNKVASAFEHSCPIRGGHSWSPDVVGKRGHQVYTYPTEVSMSPLIIDAATNNLIDRAGTGQGGATTKKARIRE